MNVREDAERRVQRILAEDMALGDCGVEVDLLRSGYLDSMTFVDLLQRLEREFGVEIQLGDVDLDRFRSIAQIAAHLTAAGAPDDVCPARGAA